MQLRVRALVYRAQGSGLNLSHNQSVSKSILQSPKHSVGVKPQADPFCVMQVISLAP